VLKQTDIPAEDQAEIFRIADKLYREDEEHRRNADASAAAAAELGVPQEYLDRAAQELHVQRLEAVKAKRRKTWIIPAIALAGIGVVLAVTLSRPPAPLSPVRMSTSSVTNVYDLSDAKVRANPETKGTISTTLSAATLQIDQFGTTQTGDFYGNIIVPAGNIREVEKVTANVAANGIDNVRVDLEADDVRWKGPVSQANAAVSISANEFQKQIRQGSNWKNTSWSPPSGKLRIAFKTGKSINDASTKGTLTVTNVELRAKQ
jgi:hypothetical protein